MGPSSLSARLCSFSECGLSAWRREAGAGRAALGCPAPSFPPSRTFPPGWALRGSHGGLCLRWDLPSAPFPLSCRGPFPSREQGTPYLCLPQGGCRGSVGRSSCARAPASEEALAFRAPRREVAHPGVGLLLVLPPVPVHLRSEVPAQLPGLPRKERVLS